MKIEHHIETIRLDVASIKNALELLVERIDELIEQREGSGEPIFYIPYDGEDKQ